tara:strand:+ start:923 stop:1099 length:177 start_codon:yes stop_codon:yes gene_type:complete
MGIDVLSICEESSHQSSSQLISTILTIVFAVFIVVDSVLAGFVVMRKARQAELEALKA